MFNYNLSWYTYSPGCADTMEWWDSEELARTMAQKRATYHGRAVLLGLGITLRSFEPSKEPVVGERR